MKLYKATIEPKSAFATSLKGDTLFGHLCWYLHFMGEDLGKMMQNYEQEPPFVVSDAFFTGFLPKPKLPSSILGESMEQKKLNRKRRWVRYEDFVRGDFSKPCKLEDPVAQRLHNSVDYRSSHTGGDFSPFASKEYMPSQKEIYLLIKEAFVEPVRKALVWMGIDGYGKDRTIGKGRFEVQAFEQIDFPPSNEYQMALSPLDPYGIEEIWYESFVRFGKLGMQRAATNPFKRPLVLADTAAVCKGMQNKRYVGRGIRGVASWDDVVHQGYAILFCFGVKR